MNRVSVDTRWQPKEDADIHEDVERRLRFSPILDTCQIRVTVVDGVVTLRGRVDTPHEKSTASQHANQGGARRVINQLDVRSRRQTLDDLHERTETLIQRASVAESEHLLRNDVMQLTTDAEQFLARVTFHRKEVITCLQEAFNRDRGKVD